MVPALAALLATGGIVAAIVTVPALGRPFVRSAPGARWREGAVPVSGGIAMAAGFTGVVAVAGWDRPGVPALVFAGAVALVVGVVDDLRPLSPRLKLSGQMVAGVVLAAGGVRLALPGPEALAVVATVAWVVVAANVLNLSDNMDGLAGGLALVAAGTVWWWWMGGPGSVVVAALTGSIAAFLAWNVHPARIFMGDGGSHWLGTTLAGIAVLDGGQAGGSGPASWVAVLLVPALLLVLPLADTVLVAVERRRHGRPLSVGGADHASHRLVRAGWSERGAVAVLWVAALAGTAAAGLARVGDGWLIAGASVVGAGLVVGGLRLARVPVYD